MPDVSVIIVNWNTRELLRDALRSLPSGFRKSTFETFVVDNGSRDGSQEMVRADFPAVTLIENGRNLGFAAANNIALRRAAGEFFLLLNSDTIMHDGAMDTLVEFMRANPDCGFCGPQLLNADGSLQNSIANFPSLLTELTQKSLLRLLWPRRFHAKNHAPAESCDVESLVGACLLARRQMCERIGLYDEDFFFFIEETEWCLRAQKAGWRCCFVPQARITHLQGQSGKLVPKPLRIEYWRSRYTYFRKHYSPAANFLLASGLLARNGINLILNALAAPLSKKARGKCGLALELFEWHLRGRPAEMGLSCTNKKSEQQ